MRQQQERPEEEHTVDKEREGKERQTKGDRTTTEKKSPCKLSTITIWSIVYHGRNDSPDSYAPAVGFWPCEKMKGKTRRKRKRREQVNAKKNQRWKREGEGKEKTHREHMCVGTHVHVHYLRAHVCRKEVYRRVFPSKRGEIESKTEKKSDPETVRFSYVIFLLLTFSPVCSVAKIPINRDCRYLDFKKKEKKKVECGALIKSVGPCVGAADFAPNRS